MKSFKTILTLLLSLTITTFISSCGAGTNSADHHQEEEASEMMDEDSHMHDDGDGHMHETNDDEGHHMDSTHMNHEDHMEGENDHNH